MLDAEHENTTNSNQNKGKNSINVMHCERPERCNEQLDAPNTVQNCDNILSTDWKEVLMILDDYFAYRDKFTHMLTMFKRMWDGHFR